MSLAQVRGSLSSRHPEAKQCLCSGEGITVCGVPTWPACLELPEEKHENQLPLRQATASSFLGGGGGGWGWGHNQRKCLLVAGGGNLSSSGLGLGGRDKYREQEERHTLKDR